MAAVESWVSGGMRRWAGIGLVAAMCFASGVGLYLAMINPPYQTDESSQVGYQASLRDGELPTVTTPVPTDGASKELLLALQRPYPFSDPEIHVANNPPHAYVIAIPFVELGARSGLPGGEVFGFRIWGILAVAGAVGCTYLLGRELTGGSELAGLVAAGLLAGVLSVSMVGSLAGLDGPALLATTGVTWAAARFVRTDSPSHALHLGLWCAAAAAVRPMSLAFAVVAGLLAIVAHLRGHGWRSLAPMAARIGLPTIVFAGWFYALNIHRYGDLTGSDALFDKVGSQPNGNVWTHLGTGGPFIQTLDYLLTDVYGRDPWWNGTGPDKWAVTLVAVALVGTAIVLAARSGREDRPATDPSPPICLASWLLVAVLGLVPMVLIAQHMAGGGAGHARYLLPVVPILAAAAALVTTRIHRWLAVGAVAAMSLALLTRVRAAGHLRYRPGPKLFAPELHQPIVAGQVPRLAALGLMMAGAVVLVGAVAAMARRGTDAATSSESPEADGAPLPRVSVDLPSSCLGSRQPR